MSVLQVAPLRTFHRTSRKVTTIERESLFHDCKFRETDCRIHLNLLQVPKLPTSLAENSFKKSNWNIDQSRFSIGATVWNWTLNLKTLWLVSSFTRAVGELLSKREARSIATETYLSTTTIGLLLLSSYHGYNYLHVTRVQRRSYSAFRRLHRAIEFIATVIHLSTGSPPLAVSVWVKAPLEPSAQAKTTRRTLSSSRSSLSSGSTRAAAFSERYS